MVRWNLKACPRCGGDMFIDRGLNGWYQQCLQCSYQHELKDLAEFEEQPTEREKELANAGGTRTKGGITSWDRRGNLRPKGSRRLRN